MLTRISSNGRPQLQLRPDRHRLVNGDGSPLGAGVGGLAVEGDLVLEVPGGLFDNAGYPGSGWPGKSNTTSEKRKSTPW
jgi:hypothetical protein